MKTKRIISLLLALIMIFTMLPVQAFAVDTANPFRDVSEGDWYYDAVQYVHANGIFIGTPDGTFAPDDGMTRGMFVVVLGRMAGVDTENYQGKSFFSDVPENAYFAPYVAWASRYGITYGSGDGKFSPDALIDRQQLATFFVRYFDAFGVDYETGANITTTPADIDSVPSYARDAVLKLWRQGLLIGDGVNFVPGSNATRVQTATLCYRMDQVIETWYKEPGVPSDRVKIDPATGKPYESGGSGGSGDSGGSGGSGDSGGSGGTQTNYYEVQFKLGRNMSGDFVILPGDSEYPDKTPKTYPANTPITSLPTPFAQNNRVFLGWYYNEDLTKPVQDGDTVNRNMTLYAKVDSLTEVRQLETPSYVTKIVGVGGTFTLQLSGEYKAGDLTIIDISAGNEPVEFTVAADGSVTPKDGWIPGHTYKVELKEDSQALFNYGGTAQPQSVRTFNIVFEKTEVERSEAGQRRQVHPQKRCLWNEREPGRPVPGFADPGQQCGDAGGGVGR